MPLTGRRPAGLRSPQCHACSRGTLQCHACSSGTLQWHSRRGPCSVSRALGARAVPVSRVGGCNTGARQAAVFHSHNKPRTSPGAVFVRGDPAPGVFVGPGAALWPPALAGDACRRQQKLAVPGRPPLVPTASGTGNPQAGDSRNPAEKPSLGSCTPGRGQRDVCVPSLLPPRALLPRHIPSRRLSGTRVLRWGWAGPDTWRPTHDHGLGHGERHMSHVPRGGTWCHGPAAPGPCVHQAWLKKRSAVLGTGLGLAVVQLLLESPSRAGHAEKHLPVLQGREVTSCSPPALFGISPGLDWKKPFQKLHLLLDQKQVTADSAAAEAG